MAFSTGRGGAGNIQSSPHITSSNNYVAPTQSHPNHLTLKTPKSPIQSPVEEKNDEKKVYYSTGRGGAGNIQSSSSIPSPKLVPQGSNTPQLLTSKVSTGRGGYGNMFKNDNPELTRKLQDVDGPLPSSKETDLYAVASNKSFSIGRGGFGNVISHTKSNNSRGSRGSNGSDTLPVNLMTISSHGSHIEREKNKKKGLIGKFKSLFE